MINHIKRWVTFICVCMALLASSCLCIGTADANNDIMRIDGQCKFSPGDNPLWSSQDYDDTTWSPATISESLQRQGLYTENGMGWYRVRFTPAERLKDAQLSVFLGRIGDADEVFLNGMKIGGEGVIGEKFIEATQVERLYMIPEHLLKGNGDNLLAVRILNTYTKGGLFDSPILLGDYRTLLVQKMKREVMMKRTETVFFTIFSLLFLFSVFLYVKGVREREYLVFGALVFLYGITYFFESLTFYELNLKTYTVQRIIFALMAILPAGFLLFATSLYREKHGLLSMCALYVSIVLSILFLFITNSLLYQILYCAWFPLLCVIVGVIFHSSIKAYRKRIRESGVIMLGIAGLFGGTVFIFCEIVGMISISNRYDDVLSTVVTPFFCLCVVSVVGIRFVRMWKSNKMLSERMLLVQEKERKRIARDLHDVVGQPLYTIKLYLEMMNAGIKAGTHTGEDMVKTITSEVLSAIKELNNVVMNLRPSFLEDMDIGNVLQWYGNSFQEKTGITVNVYRDKAQAEIGKKTKEGIFRVCQEALSNIFKHAGATSADVFLKREGNYFVLIVSDNGKGFDPSILTKHRKGLGLDIMKERVGIMGGTIKISGSAGSGTSITVNVPIK